MLKPQINTDIVFNKALDIVENRELYTDFLQQNFGPEWQRADVGDVQRKLVENITKYAEQSG